MTRTAVVFSLLLALLMVPGLTAQEEEPAEDVPEPLEGMEAVEVMEVVGDDENEEILVAQVAAPAGRVRQPGARPNNPGGQPGNPGNQQPAAPPTNVATTIEDKEFKAKDVELADGKLTIKADPPQSIPLNELQKVTLAHESKMEAKWIGQENRDQVQVGSVNEGNGIQDIRVHVSGLAAKTLRQIAIVSKPQFRVWRLDPSRSPHWKITVDRIGKASDADLWFEPPAKDLFETDLEITATFDDNSNAKATLKATGHTNNQQKFEAPAVVRRLVTLRLEGGDSLKGRILQSQPDQIVVETAWHPGLAIPLTQLRGLVFEGVSADAQAKFDEKLAKPPEDDLLLVLSKDNGLTDVSGRILSIGDPTLSVMYEEKERSIKLERLQAVVFGAHPPARQWKGPYQTFHLSSEDVISGYWSTLGEKIIEVKSPWDTDLQFPREAVVDVTGRNTKMVNLSELTPTSVEQVPYFDRVIPWAKDKSFNNRPLRVDDKIYLRGLAVHSRCVLTFDLNNEFNVFRSLLGFDEEAATRGRVDCRVLVDGKELFAKVDFHAGDKAIPVELPVKGAKQLKLEVDFGEDEDVGDHVIWANARLYRE